MPAVAQQSPSQPAAQPAMPASPDLLATEPVSTSAPAKGLHSPVPSELPQKRKIPEPARADSPVPTLLPVSPHFQSFKRLRRASDKSPPPQHASAAQQEREDLMATTVSDNEPQQAAQLAELQPVGSTGLEHIAAPAGYFQPSAAQHAEAQVEKQPRDSALQSIAKQVHRHQAAKQGQNSSLTATCRSAAQQPSTAISDIGQSQANAAAAGQSVSAVRQAVSAPMPAGQKNPSQASISQMATGSSAPAAGGLGTPTSSAVQRSKFLIASKSKSRLSQEGHARPPVSPHAHAPAKRPDIAADQPSDLALGGSAPLGTQAPPTQSNPAAQKPVPYPPGHPQTHDGVDAHAEAPETAQARPKYQKVTARKSAVAYQRRQLASAAAQAAPVLHSRKQLTGLAAQAAPVLHQRFKQVARLAQAPPVLLPRKQLTTYAAQAPHVVHPRKQLTSLAAQAAPVPHPRTQLASSADQSGLPMQHASNAQPSSAQSVSASRGLASLQATPQAASGASQPAEEDATEGSASDAKEIHSVEALGLQQSNAAQLPRELQGHGPAAFEQTGAANTSPHRHFGDAEVSAAQTSSQDKASAVLSADTNRLPHAAKDPSADALMRQQSVAADGSHAGVMQNISPDGQQHATQASHAADPERQQHGTLDSAAMQQSSADARKPTVHQDSAAADPLRQTATDAVQLVGLGTAAAAPQNTIAEVLQMQQSVAAGLHNTQPSAPAQWQTGKAAPQNATAEVLKMRQSVAAEPPKVQPIALSGWQTGQAANAGGPLATQHAGASSGVAAAQSHSRDKQTANQEASRGRLDAAASESGNVVKQDPSHTADSG